MDSQKNHPMEDRALKAAAQFCADELLAVLGIEGTVRRIAPTEQVHLEVKDFQEDFNYEMEDGTWRHLEFESDNITEEDLRRFRSYEALTSYYYKVEVTTCVVCSSSVKQILSEFTQGINTYRVQVIRLKDGNADTLIQTLEDKQADTPLERRELVQLLLTPLMDGQMLQEDRITRSIKLLQNEHEHLAKEDLVRMQSVLYALAVKFLTTTELRNVKEVLNMTILGEMLVEQVREEGLQMMVKTCKSLGLSREDTLQKILENSTLSSEKAIAYIQKFWN